MNKDELRQYASRILANLFFMQPNRDLFPFITKKLRDGLVFLHVALRFKSGAQSRQNIPLVIKSHKGKECNRVLTSGEFRVTLFAVFVCV